MATLAQVKAAAKVHGAEISVTEGIGQYIVYADLPPGRHWIGVEGNDLAESSQDNKSDTHDRLIAAGDNAAPRRNGREAGPRS